MKIYANQIDQTLAKGLSGCYLIFGDEPFQINDCRDKIKQNCKSAGFEEFIRLTDDDQFDWHELLDHCQAMSLFSSKKLIEVELTSSKMPKPAGDILKTVANELSQDTVLVLFGPKLDGNQIRSSWFKALDAVGTYIPVYDIDGQHLQRWLQQQLAKHQMNMAYDAQHYLLDFTAGNLLACAQELEKLKMSLVSQQQISLEQVKQYVADQSRYNVFQLMDNLWARNDEKTLTILQRLKGEELEPNIILWALQKDLLLINELQQALSYQQDTKEIFSQHKVWKNKQSQFNQLAHKLPMEHVQLSIDWLAKTDLALKQFSGYCAYTLFAQVLLLLLGKSDAAKLSFPLELSR